MNETAATEPLPLDIPVVDFTSPSMPPPGKMFVHHADQLRGVVSGKDPPITKELQTLYDRALTEWRFSMPLDHKNQRYMVPFVPGNIYGQIADGPRPAEVMVIGKHPGAQEYEKGANFIGQSSDNLYQALEDIGYAMDSMVGWYMTNVVKFVPPANVSFSQAWIKDCLPLLHAEMRYIQPKFILCFGTDAGKALFGPKGAVSKASGHIFDYSIPGPNGVPTVAKVMVAIHPAAVAHDVANYNALLRGIGEFMQLVKFGDIVKVEPDVVHEVIETEERLAELVDAIVNDPDPASRVIALDCEWHGRRPGEYGAFLRSIQFSHKPKHGYCVKLHRCGGEPSFAPNIDAARPHLTRLLKSTPERLVRIVGHFLRADIPWLADYGIDVLDEYLPPDLDSTHPDELDLIASLTKDFGGFELSAAVHAVAETQRLGLEMVTTRFTSIPRYDTQLEEWKDAYCDEHKISDSELYGYGYVPDTDWWDTYCCYDVDGPRRMFDLFNGVNGKPGLLDGDSHGINCRVPFLITSLAGETTLRMERSGICVDFQRAAFLRKQFETAKYAIIEQLRSKIRWKTSESHPNEFNPGSHDHVREILFGPWANRKWEEDGNLKTNAPPGAWCLNLTPVKTAGKPSKMWDRVVKAGEKDNYTPSTDRESLGILKVQYKGRPEGEVINLVRNYRFCTKVLERTLRPPEERVKRLKKSVAKGIIPSPMDIDEDDEFDAGLLVEVDRDGRLRTTFRPVETGRTATRPNLQNVSSAREAEYKNILGKAYAHPVRSIFVASPGCVFVEADIKSAELAAIAWLSGDPQMIEDVRRNMLDKKHPDFLDLHAATAVAAFKLDCEPTEKAMEAIGLKHLRTGAKAVNFGIPYKRGAPAIARQCWESDAPDVTVGDAEKMLAGYFEKYPRNAEYLAGCDDSVNGRGYMISGYRRARRFFRTTNDSDIADQQREACNFNIQSVVADAISLAMHYVGRVYRCRTPDGPWFRPLLNVHDALMFETRPHMVKWLVETVIRPAMVDYVQFWPRYLDGTIIPGRGPYHFGIDVKVFERWGEKLDKDRGIAMGIDAAYL